MAFDIKINETPGTSNTASKAKAYVTVSLIIGKESELVEVPLDFWDVSDYRQQWTDACDRVVRAASSALVLGMPNLGNPSYALNLWPMYRSGNNIYLQNKLVDARYFTKQFSLEDIYNEVGVRKQHDTDGNVISEWHTTIDEINAFLSLIKESS